MARERKKLPGAINPFAYIRKIEARNSALERVTDAARDLHDKVGDKDNGPARTFLDPWEKLDSALRGLDLLEKEGE